MDPIRGAQALDSGVSGVFGSPDDVCPRCDEPWGSLPPASTALFDGAPLRRCRRCGTRHAATAAGLRYVFTCRGCSLPFLAETLVHSEPRCESCHDGKVPADLPDRAIAVAIESAICTALDESCTFVRSPALADYLDRIAREVARQIGGLPEWSRIALVDDETVGTLALPSGLVLLSVGAVESAEDEAELVFLIGHEVAHAASAEASTRLARRGLHSLSRDRDPATGQAWLRAIEDISVLGYGRRREREADATSIEAMIELGYDPESALRLMQRLERRADSGDARLAEYLAAHPPPGDRRRALEKRLYGRRLRGSMRVNREVFRRAAGSRVLSNELRRVPDLEAATCVVAPAEDEKSRWAGLGPWLVAALALAAIVFLLLKLAL